MKILSLTKSIKSIVKKVNRSIKYNPYNIAEYHRELGAQIGKDCYIGNKSFGSEPYLVKIGDHVAIAAGTVFITHTSGWNFRDRIPDIHLFGKIEVGDNTYIGINSILLPDIKIGKNCLVAAGSVVTRDIPDNSIAAGVPAKVIGDMDVYFEKMSEAWKVQRPSGFCDELEKGTIYTPIQITAAKSKPENRELLRKHLTKYFWGKEI